MSESETHTVVRLWRAIWLDDGDPADFLADPYTRHGQGGTVVLTPLDHQTRIRAVTDHLRGTAVRVHQLTDDGEVTFVRLSLEGVNVTTGNQVTMAMLGQYRLTGDKVAESWTLHLTGDGWE